MNSAWMRCSDAAAGTDAVKARRTEYLPKLSGQSEADYDAYIKRAMYYPATDRTISGLVGAVMRRPPTVECPTEILGQLTDVTMSDDPLTEFIFSVLYQVLLVGRVGISLDMTQQPSLNARPYWMLRYAYQIINWQTKQMPDGQTALSLVVLKEDVPSPIQTDPFRTEVITRYRVLALLDNQYVVTTWQKQGDKFMSASPPIIPTRRGEPLNFIPFVIIGPHGVSSTVDKPPLLDLVDVNLSHYRNSADLEHGRHFVALPTPYITGWVEPVEGSGPLRIGSGAAWTLQNPDSKVGMLEFTGQGLGALERALEQKERTMAVLGARLLEQQPRQGETAETVRLRQSGEHAVLGSIASAVSQGLTKVLNWHAWWAGASDVEPMQEHTDPHDCTLELNKDFFDTTLTAQEAQTLMQLWQAKGITYETLYWNLQRGDWARPNVSAHDEMEMLTGTEESSEEEEQLTHGTPESEEAHERQVSEAMRRMGAVQTVKPKAAGNAPAE